MIEPINTPAKPKRRYKRITKQTVAEFELARIQEGNGTAAVRLIDETALDPARRANLIAIKSRELDSSEYIDNMLSHLGVAAIERVQELISSRDERIATKNAHFVIEHVRGKAVQRSETKHLTLNIQSVLQ